MTTCTKRYSDLPFAHRQPNHSGHCKFIHGHNWSFEIEFASSALDECGFVVDFGRLGDVERWLETMFDHTLVVNATDPKLSELEKCHILDIIDLRIIPDCSSEGLAHFVASQVDDMLDQRKDLGDRKVWVVRVTCYEDDRNSATWHREEMESR